MIRDRIPYETLVQDALRNVIRQVLERVASDGLPGDHHFYITFHTNMAGVEMSARLKERYPDHVTIVLQNQFWDLVVEEEHFAVTLSFSDVPERLVVPFMAIQAFYDPVASFEASFDITPQIPSALPTTTIFVPKNEEDSQEQASPATMRVGVRNKKARETIQENGQNNPQDETHAGKDRKGAEVVSLDAFRKK